MYLYIEVEKEIKVMIFLERLSENLNNEKIPLTDNRETEVNYQCISYFGIKNDIKSGMESHGAVVFRHPRGG